MRTIFSCFLIVLAQMVLSAEIHAQMPEVACPSVSVESTIRNPSWVMVPGGGACPGAPVTFRAATTGIDPKSKPTFYWTISAGKIIDGQGTAVITVSTEEVPGAEVTATVEVGGLSELKPDCNKTAQATVQVAICCLPPCPTISISCPTYISEVSDPLIIAVSISGGAPSLNPKYKWQVSAGKIISGQGTPEIKVETSETTGQRITATVEVEGMPPECDRSESCSISYVLDPPLTRKFDEYGEVSWISEETRLVNFGTQLQLEPEAQGYIIVYGPRRVKQHLARSQKFIVEKSGIDPQRITQINGGYHKKMIVQLWIVPVGATPPKPTPNF
jgi:PKD-like domain